MRCEDYPCCGHGPPPLGDGGGCPDERGRFRCLGCGEPQDPGGRSSYCPDCLSDPRTFHDPDCPGCPTCEWGPEADPCPDCGEDREPHGCACEDER